MRDQKELALRCLEVESSGASVLGFLTGLGFVSPRATWERLQLNELGRKANELNDGKGEKSMTKLTLEAKKKAVQIALDGGDYLGYLKDHGAKNPAVSWRWIVENVKKADPESYEKLQARLNRPKAEAAERAEEPKPAKDPKLKAPGTARTFAEDGEHLKVINKPLRYGDFTVRAVEGTFGRYSRDVSNGTDYIDFESKEGDELHMPVKAWKEYIEELRKAARVLGVDLG